MFLLERVRQFLRQHTLAGPTTRVLAAVSGGSDSVALCHLLRELSATGDLHLVGVAHFNHQLRADAGRDEEVSASVAAAVGVPWIGGCEDVKDRARRERCSTEVAAREARYEFFERARQQSAADVVALGHTRDDQAETVLLRLLRGAGPRGLSAMHPRRGTVVRPLLDCRRGELRAYLEGRRVPWIEDETNLDTGIPRNRVRAELMPLLVARFNPGVVDALANQAELAREMWSWLEGEAATFDAAASGQQLPASPATDLHRELSVDQLRQAPVALQRLILWRAMNEVSGGRTVPFAHVDAALGLLGVESGTIDAPGHRVHRLGGCLVLTGRPSDTHGRWAPHRGQATSFAYPLSIPGEVEIAEANCSVSVEVVPAAAGLDAHGRAGVGSMAIVGPERCPGGLVVRSRRPGDRFRPAGGRGQKKLQDYFVDCKVARTGRDRVPLVVDRETDRIVWVAGYVLDEAFRVTNPSQSVLLLRLKLLGGCA
jgi:tRNA(Ile)-lysidine synthase